MNFRKLIIQDIKNKTLYLDVEIIPHTTYSVKNNFHRK